LHAKSFKAITVNTTIYPHCIKELVSLFLFHFKNVIYRKPKTQFKCEISLVVIWQNRVSNWNFLSLLNYLIFVTDFWKGVNHSIIWPISSIDTTWPFFNGNLKCAYFQLVDMGLFNRIRPDPGFVSPVRSDPGFASPIRYDPIRSDPIRSDPDFVNDQLLPTYIIQDLYFGL